MTTSPYESGAPRSSGNLTAERSEMGNSSCRPMPASQAFKRGESWGPGHPDRAVAVPSRTIPERLQDLDCGGTASQ